MLRLAQVLAVLWLLAMPAAAQESSIVTLGEPEDAAAAAEVTGPAADVETPAPCGRQTITMARMQWPSSALLAEIHAQVLRDQFACVVEIQEADMATAGSSMGANGQPAVAPEMWVGRIAEIWNAGIAGQKVRQGGTSYAEQVLEGWFIPDYAAEAYPEIVTIEGLAARVGELGDGGRLPRFISCPPDWGCNLINRNMLRAHGLERAFEIVEPANRFELDTLIAEAVGRREPIVFYYWQPNAILAQFTFVELALAPYDAENFLCLGRIACATPLPSGFAPDPVVIAVAEWVYLEAPQVAAYFQLARMPVTEMNRMLQQLSEPGATVETVAARFMAERGEVWRPWAGLSVEPAADAAGVP